MIGRALAGLARQRNDFLPGRAGVLPAPSGPVPLFAPTLADGTLAEWDDGAAGTVTTDAGYAGGVGIAGDHSYLKKTFADDPVLTSGIVSLRARLWNGEVNLYGQYYFPLLIGVRVLATDGPPQVLYRGQGLGWTDVPYTITLGAYPLVELVYDATGTIAGDANSRAYLFIDGHQIIAIDAYSAAVRIVDAYGSGVYKVADYVVGDGYVGGDLPLPPAPTDVGASSTAGDPPGTLTVSWALTPLAASYRLERSPDGAGDWMVVVADSTATSYTDSGLTPGATAFYRLIAVNATGDSAPSAVASAAAAS